MSSHTPERRVSRRSTIAALTVAGVGATLPAARAAAAQEPGLAEHPIVGSWLVRSMDNAVGPAFFRADGTFVHSGSPLMLGLDGTVTYLSPQNGVWELDSENERGVHFISIQSMFDGTGGFTGTWTIDAYPGVSEDGARLEDDWTRSTVTVRDADNEVIAVLGNNGSIPAITGVRLAASELVFPPAAAPAATPPG